MKEQLRMFIGLIILLVIVGFVSSVKAQQNQVVDSNCVEKDFPHFFILDTTVRTVNVDPTTGNVRGYSILRNYSTTGQVQADFGVCNRALKERVSRTGLKLGESNPIKNHQQLLVEGKCYPTKLCPGTYDEDFEDTE